MPKGLKGFQEKNDVGFKKGYTPWNKGIIVFKKCAVKDCVNGINGGGRGLCNKHYIRLRRFGDPNEFNKPWSFKTEGHSFETRKRLSEMNRGEKSHNWKGGVSSLHEMIRSSFEYKCWRTAIFIRDKSKCVICGHMGRDLQIDHYPKSFAKILYENNIKSLDEAINCKDLWDKENNRILCYECHKKTDNFGFKGHINAHTP